MTIFNDILALELDGPLHKEASKAAANAYLRVVLADPSLAEGRREQARLCYLKIFGGKRALVVTRQHLENLASKGLSLDAGENDVIIPCDGEDAADAKVQELINSGQYAMVGRVRADESQVEAPGDSEQGNQQPSGTHRVQIISATAADCAEDPYDCGVLNGNRDSVEKELGGYIMAQMDAEADGDDAEFTVRVVYEP